MQLAKNICILFHCIYEDGALIDGPHQELFVSKSELRELFEKLLAREYCFSLPWELKHDNNNCVITFDDGYYNNINVLSICKEYAVPLILFVNSYNIITGKPFIWDIWEENCEAAYPFGEASSRELYSRYDHKKFYSKLENDFYRPFNLKELRDFGNNHNVHLGLHSHHHQPMTMQSKIEWESELSNNKQFFIDNNLEYVNDLSLPCGLYTFGALNWVKKRVNRIYTINGGTFNQGKRVIDRISLVSPKITGVSLIDQVDRSTSPSFIRALKNKKNHLTRLKYAYIG
ncbi:MAG: polysaccharide deacetylase family protein [bacterium]